jgi:hypothetical protein
MQNCKVEILNLGSAATYLGVKALHDITTMLWNRSRGGNLVSRCDVVCDSKLVNARYKFKNVGYLTASKAKRSDTKWYAIKY